MNPVPNPKGFSLSYNEPIGRVPEKTVPIDTTINSIEIYDEYDIDPEFLAAALEAGYKIKFDYNYCDEDREFKLIAYTTATVENPNYENQLKDYEARVARHNAWEVWAAAEKEYREYQENSKQRALYEKLKEKFESKN